jgi:hypothetical protein
VHVFVDFAVYQDEVEISALNSCLQLPISSGMAQTLRNHFQFERSTVRRVTRPRLRGVVYFPENIHE